MTMKPEGIRFKKGRLLITQFNLFGGAIGTDKDKCSVSS